jgi:hypothetical protein
MNLLLAFLHGEGIVLWIFLLVGVGVLVGAALLFYIWLRRTKLSALYLAFAYLIPVAVLCVLYAVSADYWLSLLSYGLTLPWSALGFWGLLAIPNSGFSDRELDVLFAVVMLFCAGVNAVILYGVGVMARRLIK